MCLVPLLAALRGRGPLSRLGVGAATGALTAIVVAVGPAATGAASFFERPLWQAWLFTAAIGAVFGATGFATFALCAGDPLRGSPARAALRAAAAFAAAELVRARVFGGLPWLLLCHALAPAPAALQLASVGGVAALSAWLAAIATALLRAGVGPGRRAAIGVAFVCCAAGLLAAAPLLGDPSGRPGSVGPASAGAPAGARRVGLVQPALPMREWADPGRVHATVERLIALSRDRAEPLDLLVWPENAIQALLPANDALVADALAALRDDTHALLLGAPRYDPADPATRFNAALLYRESAIPVAIHDKNELLPFFEAVPRWLVARGLHDTHLRPGARPAVLDVDAALRVGPLLCYELLFHDVSRAQVRAGANVLVNLSNDAWFAGSGGAEQHFAAAVVVAVAARRPLLRSTPTGVTAAVDAFGRVVARLPAGEPGILVVDVVPAGRAPLAVRLGLWPEIAALAVALGWTAREIAQRGVRQSSIAP